MKSGEGSKSNIHVRLGKDEDFLSLIDSLEEYIGEDRDLPFDPEMSIARLEDELDARGGPNAAHPIVYSHPKFAMLEQIISEHFELRDDTKAIVFCKVRLLES